MPMWDWWYKSTLQWSLLVCGGGLGPWEGALLSHTDSPWSRNKITPSTFHVLTEVHVFKFSQSNGWIMVPAPLLRSYRRPNLHSCKLLLLSSGWIFTCSPPAWHYTGHLAIKIEYKIQIQNRQNMFSWTEHQTIATPYFRRVTSVFAGLLVSDRLLNGTPGDTTRAQWTKYSV